MKFQPATQTYKWRLQMHKIIANVYKCTIQNQASCEKGRIRNSASWKKIEKRSNTESEEKNYARETAQDPKEAQEGQKKA